jgi:hypothetical protein
LLAFEGGVGAGELAFQAADLTNYASCGRASKPSVRRVVEDYDVACEASPTFPSRITRYDPEPTAK